MSLLHHHVAIPALRPSFVVWLCRHRARAASLLEFALVAPLLILLVLGGTSLLVRGLYRDALDEAAEQGAWAAARTGGDLPAIRMAVGRAIPFVSPGDLQITARSSGYHTPVDVAVTYVGDAVTSLPFFNGPFSPALASATNQQERSFDHQIGGGP